MLHLLYHKGVYQSYTESQGAQNHRVFAKSMGEWMEAQLAYVEGWRAGIFALYSNVPYTMRWENGCIIHF